MRTASLKQSFITNEFSVQREEIAEKHERHEEASKEEEQPEESAKKEEAEKEEAKKEEAKPKKTVKIEENGKMVGDIDVDKLIDAAVARKEAGKDGERGIASGQ